MSEPTKAWWTTSELAAAQLPGLPTTRRGIDRIAKTDWRCQAEFARERTGRGGGWEYNWRLLPLLARKHLLPDVAQPKPSDELRSRDDVWAWFDGLKAPVKAKAAKRLEILRAVETLRAGGTDVLPSVYEVAQAEGVGHATIFRWFAMVDGVEPSDWLAYLAPRNAGSAGAAQTKLDQRYYDEFKSLYLRFEGPAFAEAYRVANTTASDQGWPVVAERTLRRRLNADVPRTIQVLARAGLRAFEECFAPQIRDKSMFEAMDFVNADFHKFDVFVSWPGIEKPVRPQVCAFQDLYSGLILSHKVDLVPNAVATMRAFGKMVDDYGIPRNCLFDNGMEFAAKQITGGAKTRRRFKIKDDEPDGILKLLGVKVHWATVAHGQAKPVERAFGDWARDIAKDPRFAGAYVGHKPDAKPENYMSKAIPRDEFLRVVSERIAELNARAGRRSPNAKGRSFNDTFAASYANAPIQKATNEQRRLWMMGHSVNRLDKKNGRLRLHKNFYYSPWMAEYAGERVVARFDPEDLHGTEVYIYTLQGEFLGTTLCQKPEGFNDLEAAREHAAQKRRRRKAAKDALQIINPVPLDDAAKRYDDASRAQSATNPVSGTVVEAKFGTRVGPKGVRTPAHPEIPTAKVTELKASRPQKHAQPQHHTDKMARFNWALELEAALLRGERVGSEELADLRAYQSGADYRALLRIHQSTNDTSSAG